MNEVRIIIYMLLLWTADANAQRIMGYFPSYRDAQVNTIEFAKMTDVVFAFMNFNPANGNLDLTNQPQLNNLISAARAAKPNIRIHISTGGGGYGTGGQFPTLINNATARANFVSQMASLIQSKNLDGWDLDWEYPQSAAEKNNHERLITDMRIALDAKENSMCKKLDVSIAVGGLMNTSPPDTWKVNANTMNYVDNVLIMAYDGGPGVPGDPSHSAYAFAQDALDGWNAWGLPYSKMILGVPFYGWVPYFAQAQTYAAISPANLVAVFNTDYYNGYYYNGAPTLRSKIDLAMRTGKKTQGIMIWELGQDAVGSPYSLLNAIHQKFTQDYSLSGSAPNPCTLPVEFLDFSGTKNGNLVALQWITRNEKDSDYFEIERSFDANTFSKVAKLESPVYQSYESVYEYQDTVLSGTVPHFYRIAQYDKDRSVSYSKTIRVASTVETKFFVYPEPVDHTFIVQCSSAFPNDVLITMSLKDVNGREVLRTNISSVDDNSIDISNLSMGVYFMYLYSESKVIIRKISKL